MLPEQRLADFIAGATDPEESAALEAEILADPAALKEWCDQQRLHAALTARFDPHTENLEAAILASIQGPSNEAMEKRVLDQTVGSEGLRYTRSPFLIRSLRWGLGLAAGLAIVLGMICLLRPAGPVGTKAPPQAAVRCTVKAIVEERWAAGSSQPAVGDVLSTASLALESGVVQLEYETGASLAIEGPARWKLTGGNSVEFSAGKLSAQVPKGAAGFAVTMPRAKAVDLSTRFGVWMRDDGSMETHVFEGMVELTLGPESTRPDRQMLARGMALAVDQRGQATSIAAREQDFSRRVGHGTATADSVDLADAFPKAGLRLWLSAGRLDQADGVITAIKDLRGNGNDARRDSADRTSNPALAVDAASGQPVLRFTGDDIGFVFNRISDIRTAFWVISKDPAAFGKRNGKFVLGDKQFNDFHAGWVDDTIFIPIADPTHLSSYLRDGRTWLNGRAIDASKTLFPRQLGLISITSAGPVRASQLARDRDYPGRSWQGDIAEILLYNVELSDAERLAVEKYLTRKYSIPSDQEAR